MYIYNDVLLGIFFTESYHINFQCRYHFILLHRIKKDFESITSEAPALLSLFRSHSAFIMGVLLCSIIASFVGSFMSSSFEDNIMV